MESDRRPLLKLHINVIIGFWSFIAYVVVFVLSFIRPELFGRILPLIRIGFSLLIIVAAAIEGAEIRVLRNKYKFFQSLSDENFYTLGAHTTFFNLEAFKDKVHELEGKFSLRNKKRYLLAFSPTATNIAGGVEEASLPLDTFVYWNDQGWCGSTISVTLGNAYTEEGLVHIQYSATGSCNWGLQIFYKNSSLTNGTEYTLSFKMKVAVGGVYIPKANEPVNEINLTADTWTDVSYDYTEAAGAASLKICVPAQTAAENTIELKDFSWVAK